MLTISQALVALIVFLLVMQFLNLQQARKHLPPGPVPLPLVGNLLQLKFQFHRDLLMKLAKTHGDIFTLWFGRTPIIILNGFHAVKDGLTTHPEDVSGRLLSPFFKTMAQGKGKPLDPSFYLFHSISNVICAVVFGYRFPSEDENFHKLLKATENIFRFGGSLGYSLYEFFPWIMDHLPGPHKKAFSSYEVLNCFAREEIRKHLERGTPDEPEDFIDFYLAEIEKAKDGTKSAYDEDNLAHSVIDLFLGGSETTSTTLHWGLLYMVAYPDIQEKVQQELDAVLGSSQLICYEDRRKVSYTNAVIHEIQRFSNIISVGMPRICVRNTELLGFPLSKGTIVLPNIASSLYDPEQWKSPRQFNPGHFLDKDGNFVSQEAFLPFSAGHRVCLGEHLARTELFIFFSNLLRAFTLRLAEGVKQVNIEPVFTSTLQPHPYRVCAIPR
ncbi:PREDICTED: cytochrome P450 2C31-like isoform X2 [Crocodylus porosus]|uniref:cytochrome P450 2C31-like isoform X2 n=1 Tax=Crocodylus porosus TaxID=8502 RepID=UPI00093A2199|nr:PREDICTED: cytochrome P450 2C31-like isoform X2 [Crocodylus porosus]